MLSHIKWKKDHVSPQKTCGSDHGKSTRRIKGQKSTQHRCTWTTTSQVSVVEHVEHENRTERRTFGVRRAWLCTCSERGRRVKNVCNLGANEGLRLRLVYNSWKQRHAGPCEDPIPTGPIGRRVVFRGPIEFDWILHMLEPA